ncbi:MAG: phage holin family protein [Methylophilus sp.]|uniref:phage holin family protein n=1 Tax=Methylophilus sp. TaxID=29541 RepID=UPI003FA1353A
MTDNLLHLRHHVAEYTEERAKQIKQDFQGETERLATSLIGILVVFSMFIFTGLLGLMWLFSLLWEHPNRTLILAVAMSIPALIGVIAYFAVRRVWQKKTLFASSISIISSDWKLFRTELADEQPEVDQPAPANDADAVRSATR